MVLYSYTLRAEASTNFAGCPACPNVAARWSAMRAALRHHALLSPQRGTSRLRGNGLDPPTSGRWGAVLLARQSFASPLPVAASVHLSRMLDRAKGARVSIGWLMGELGERSFGLTLLGMAVVALVPGASTFMGLLIAWPAIQLAEDWDSVLR